MEAYAFTCSDRWIAYYSILSRTAYYSLVGTSEIVTECPIELQNDPHIIRLKNDPQWIPAPLLPPAVPSDPNPATTNPLARVNPQTLESNGATIASLAEVTWPQGITVHTTTTNQAAGYPSQPASGMVTEMSNLDRSIQPQVAPIATATSTALSTRPAPTPVSLHQLSHGPRIIGADTGSATGPSLIMSTSASTAQSEVALGQAMRTLTPSPYRQRSITSQSTASSGVSNSASSNSTAPPPSRSPSVSSRTLGEGRIHNPAAKPPTGRRISNGTSPQPSAPAPQPVDSSSLTTTSTIGLDHLLISAARQVAEVQFASSASEPVPVCVIDKWEMVWDPLANRMFYTKATDSSGSQASGHGQGIDRPNDDQQTDLQNIDGPSWQPHASIADFARYTECRFRDFLLQELQTVVARSTMVSHSFMSPVTSVSTLPPHLHNALLFASVNSNDVSAPLESYDPQQSTATCSVTASGDSFSSNTTPSPSPSGRKIQQLSPVPSQPSQQMQLQQLQQMQQLQQLQQLQQVQQLQTAQQAQQQDLQSVLINFQLMQRLQQLQTQQLQSQLLQSQFQSPSQSPSQSQLPSPSQPNASVQGEPQLQAQPIMQLATPTYPLPIQTQPQLQAQQTQMHALIPPQLQQGPGGLYVRTQPLPAAIYPSPSPTYQVTPAPVHLSSAGFPAVTQSQQQLQQQQQQQQQLQPHSANAFVMSGISSTQQPLGAYVPTSVALTSAGYSLPTLSQTPLAQTSTPQANLTNPEPRNPSGQELRGSIQSSPITQQAQPSNTTNAAMLGILTSAERPIRLVKTTESSSVTDATPSSSSRSISTASTVDSLPVIVTTTTTSHENPADSNFESQGASGPNRPRGILRRTVPSLGSEVVAPPLVPSESRVQGFSSFGEQLCEDTRRSIGSRAGVGNGDMLLSEVDRFQRLGSVERQGYVLKRGNGLFKRWKPRWMKLKEGRLCYWATHDDAERSLLPIRDVSVIGASFYTSLPQAISPPNNTRVRLMSTLRKQQTAIELLSAEQTLTVEEVRKLRAAADAAAIRIRAAIEEVKTAEDKLNEIMIYRSESSKRDPSRRMRSTTTSPTINVSTTKTEADTTASDSDSDVAQKNEQMRRAKDRRTRRSQQRSMATVTSRNVGGVSTNHESSVVDSATASIQVTFQNVYGNSNGSITTKEMPCINPLPETIAMHMASVAKARIAVRNVKAEADAAQERAERAEAILLAASARSSEDAAEEFETDQTEPCPCIYLLVGAKSASTPYALVFEDIDERDAWIDVLERNGAVNACLPISHTDFFRFDGGDGAPPATLYGDRIEVQVKDDVKRTIALTPKSNIQPRGTKSLRLVVAACPERRVSSSYYVFRLRSTEATLSWYKLIREVIVSQQGDLFGASLEWATKRSPVCIPLPVRDCSAWLLANGKGITDVWLTPRSSDAAANMTEALASVIQAYNDSKFDKILELFRNARTVAHVLTKYVSSLPDSVIPSQYYQLITDIRLEAIPAERLLEISFLQRQRLRRARNANSLCGYSPQSVGAAVADPNMFLPARSVETRMIHALRKAVLRLNDTTLLTLSQLVYTLKELYAFWHDADARRYRLGYIQRRTERRVQRLILNMRATQQKAREQPQTASSTTSSRSSRAKTTTSTGTRTSGEATHHNSLAITANTEFNSAQFKSDAELEQHARESVLKAESRERHRRHRTRLERRRKLARQTARAERRALLLQEKRLRAAAERIQASCARDTIPCADGQSHESMQNECLSSSDHESLSQNIHDSDSSVSSFGSSCWDNSEYDEESDDMGSHAESSPTSCDPRIFNPWPSRLGSFSNSAEIDVDNSDDEMDDECDERDDEFLATLDAEHAAKSNEAVPELDDNEAEHYAQAFAESRRELQNILINFSHCILREPPTMEAPQWVPHGQREAVKAARADAVLRTLILQYDVIFPLGPPFPF